VKIKIEFNAIHLMYGTFLVYSFSSSWDAIIHIARHEAWSVN